jgi:hypothetical protein
MPPSDAAPASESTPGQGARKRAATEAPAGAAGASVNAVAKRGALIASTTELRDKPIALDILIQELGGNSVLSTGLEAAKGVNA